MACLRLPSQRNQTFFLSLYADMCSCIVMKNNSARDQHSSLFFWIVLSFFRFQCRQLTPFIIAPLWMESLKSSPFLLWVFLLKTFSDRHLTSFYGNKAWLLLSNYWFFLNVDIFDSMSMKPGDNYVCRFVHQSQFFPEFRHRLHHVEWKSLQHIPFSLFCVYQLEVCEPIEHKVCEVRVFKSQFPTQQVLIFEGNTVIDLLW